MATIRYWATTPSLGAQFYQAYPPSPVNPTGPNQLQQLGIEPGTLVLGNLHTQWLFAVNGAAALAQNAAANIDPALFTVGGTGGLTGHSPIAIPANAGAWFEISGATLNLAMIADPPKQEGESDEDYDARLIRVHAAVGENPDGTPLKESDRPPEPAGFLRAPRPKLEPDEGPYPGPEAMSYAPGAYPQGAHPAEPKPGEHKPGDVKPGEHKNDPKGHKNDDNKGHNK